MKLLICERLTLDLFSCLYETVVTKEKKCWLSELSAKHFLTGKIHVNVPQVGTSWKMGDPNLPSWCHTTKTWLMKVNIHGEKLVLKSCFVSFILSSPKYLNGSQRCLNALRDKMKNIFFLTWWRCFALMLWHNKKPATSCVSEEEEERHHWSCVGSITGIYCSFKKHININCFYVF